MRRREFIALVGGVAAGWPLPARAQQTAIPVIGYLSPESAEFDAVRISGLRRGLNEAGFVVATCALIFALALSTCMTAGLVRFASRFCRTSTD